MTRARIGSLPLRARIMAIVIGGAILPLALIAAWLTASAARSGRALLHSELDSSVAEVAARIEDRWLYRDAELALLANNEPAHRVLAGAALDVNDAKYFQELSRTLRPSIRDFSYRDARGQVLWSSEPAVGGGDQATSGFGAVAGFDAAQAILIRRPILDSAGRAIGVVEARVLLSAIMPTDSLRLIVAGAALAIHDRASGEWIGGQPITSDASLVASSRTLRNPPLDLRLAASDARYVQPFTRAARIGLFSLLLVAGVALGLTSFLTTRLTKALEELVDAAAAVSSGDLARSVPRHSDDEVGRLADAFNRMTESLRRTLRDLSQREALAAVGQFAAAISHEVRNALTSVRLDVQRLQERLPAPEDRALAQRALRNVHRLNAIVTGSLRVARTNPDTMRPIVVEGVVRAAMTAAEPAFLENAVQAQLDTREGDHERVRGDAGALEQLFLNLLMNAAQATPNGGVTRITIDARAETVVVRIADTGGGMSQDQLARLGVPFSSSKPKGTGLGFPIARQIAIAHGGDVRVVASSSSGTTVEVVLPRLNVTMDGHTDSLTGPPQMTKTTAVSLMLVGFLAAIAGASAGSAQTAGTGAAPPVTLANTHAHLVRSKINGRDYLIQVALPNAYSSAKPGDTTRYRTLYLLDGVWEFPLLFAQMQFAVQAQPMKTILVGVATADSQGQKRSFDYSPPLTRSDSAYFRPPNPPAPPPVGCAPLFLRVLREEIIPLVDSTYRTSSDRGIEGASLGWLFVAYALLEDPDLFTRYALISPSLWYPWGRAEGLILTREREFARQHSTLRKTVVISVGSDENPTMIAAVWRFVDQLCTSLSGGYYKGLDLGAEILAGQGHASTAARVHVLNALYPPDSMRVKPGRRVMEECR